jgi:hypothetical protein
MSTPIPPSPTAPGVPTVILHPDVNVSALGRMTLGPTAPMNNGVGFGPDTPSTKTCGIQEAVNHLAPTGGTVTLQSGTYVVSQAINLKPKVRLRGFSRASVTIQLAPGSNAQRVLFANGVSEVEISDLKVDVNGSAQSSGNANGIEVVATAAGQSVSIHDVDVLNAGYATCTFGHGILLHAAAPTAVSARLNNFTVANSQGVFSAGVNLYLLNVNGVIASNFTLDTPSSATLATPNLWMRNCQDCVISNFVMTNSGNGSGGGTQINAGMAQCTSCVAGPGTITNVCDDAFDMLGCVSCTFTGITVNGTVVGPGLSILPTSAGVPSSYCSIVGCTVRSTVAPAYAIFDSTFCAIIGCTAEGSTGPNGYGIIVQPTMPALTTQNNLISDCVSVGNSQIGICERQLKGTLGPNYYFNCIMMGNAVAQVRLGNPGSVARNIPGVN